MSEKENIKICSISSLLSVPWFVACGFLVFLLYKEGHESWYTATCDCGCVLQNINVVSCSVADTDWENCGNGEFACKVINDQGGEETICPGDVPNKCFDKSIPAQILSSIFIVLVAIFLGIIGILYCLPLFYVLHQCRTASVQGGQEIDSFKC